MEAYASLIINITGENVVDYTDDWWDEKEAFWVESPPKDKLEYRIYRAQKLPTFGSPGFIVQWRIYQVFDSEKERDAALRNINRDHPSWRLKAGEGNPYLERLGINIPEKGIN